MNKLDKTLDINALSKSQVSQMAGDLSEHVEQFRHRPLDAAGPFSFVSADALTVKVHESSRVLNAVVLISTGFNSDRHREVLGQRMATSETEVAWNEFFADLVARGLAGARLVTSDARFGLWEAITEPRPLVWTATSESVLKKVARGSVAFQAVKPNHVFWSRAFGGHADAPKTALEQHLTPKCEKPA